MIKMYATRGGDNPESLDVCGLDIPVLDGIGTARLARCAFRALANVTTMDAMRLTTLRAIRPDLFALGLPWPVGRNGLDAKPRGPRGQYELGVLEQQIEEAARCSSNVLRIRHDTDSFALDLREGLGLLAVQQSSSNTGAINLMEDYASGVCVTVVSEAEALDMGYAATRQEPVTVALEAGVDLNQLHRPDRLQIA